MKGDVNNQSLASEKDLVDEVREDAAVRNASFKKRVAAYQHRHVKPRGRRPRPSKDRVNRETSAEAQPSAHSSFVRSSTPGPIG